MWVISEALVDWGSLGLEGDETSDSYKTLEAFFFRDCFLLGTEENQAQPSIAPPAQSPHRCLVPH